MLRHVFAPLALLAVLLVSAPGCVTEQVGEQQQTSELRETEIDRRINEIEFMQGHELMQNLERLVRMRDEAYPQIRAALAEHPDDHTRANLIYVFAALGDRRNIPYIRPQLEHPSPKVRFEAAATLVEMGDSEGFPVLVNGLSHSEVRWRFKCFETLRAATGQDFGYVHDGDLEVRRAAIVRWHDWLQDIQASAL